LNNVSFLVEDAMQKSQDYCGTLYRESVSRQRKAVFTDVFAMFAECFVLPCHSEHSEESFGEANLRTKETALVATRTCRKILHPPTGGFRMTLKRFGEEAKNDSRCFV